MSRRDKVLGGGKCEKNVEGGNYVFFLSSPNTFFTGLHDNNLPLDSAEAIQAHHSHSRPQHTSEPATDKVLWRLFHAGSCWAKGCHQLSGLLSASAATKPPASPSYFPLIPKMLHGYFTGLWHCHSWCSLQEVTHLAARLPPPLPSSMISDVSCTKQPERAWKTDWQHNQ